MIYELPMHHPSPVSISDSQQVNYLLKVSYCVDSKSRNMVPKLSLADIQPVNQLMLID